MVFGYALKLQHKGNRQSSDTDVTVHQTSISEIIALRVYTVVSQQYLELF